MTARTDLLYAVTDAYRAVWERAEQYAAEHEGEVSPSLGAEIEALGLSRDELIEQHARELRNVEAGAKAYSDESARMYDEASRLSCRAERLKHCLASVLGEGNKWASTTAKLSWRKSERVEVTVEPETLPADVIRIVPATTQADKKAIKAALDSGRIIEGCSIVVINNLQVR
jgi:hypothetical protein